MAANSKVAMNTKEMQQIIRLVAKWMNESISAEQLDRFDDHIEGAKVRGNDTQYEIANTLQAALRREF